MGPSGPGLTHGGCRMGGDPISWCNRKRRWVRVPDKWKADDG
ncbi:hypothetical protein AFCDBAGC_4440 [Methylobacterium cerastii]|uniref:Uncharacterized protein n=1 Tax=Methylobacterium cerastii TaxID=932741 RepID=A0ABQ4QMT9_9HYPH|nr:hypothetical protein AFCDBAGC_4440 [Methylobacterium cerastii]